MFHAINRLKVHHGHEADLIRRFAAPGGLEGAPGFIEFRLLQRNWHPHAELSEEPIEFLAMTIWQKEDDFTAWVASDAFKEAHSGPRMVGFAAPGDPGGYTTQVHRKPSASA